MRGIAGTAALFVIVASSDSAAQDASEAERRIGPACIEIYEQKSAQDVAAAFKRHNAAADAALNAAREAERKAERNRASNERRLERELQAARKESADAKARLSAILSEQPEEAELNALIAKDAGELQRIGSLENELKLKQDEYNQAQSGVKVAGQKELAADLQKRIGELQKLIGAGDKSDIEARLNVNKAKLERKTKEAPGLKNATIPALDAREARLSKELSDLKQAGDDASREVNLAGAVIAGLERCAGRRAAELHQDYGPLLKKLDAIVARLDGLSGQQDALVAKSGAICSTVTTEPATTSARIDALGAEADALQARANAQKSLYATAKLRAELAARARADAAAGLGEVSAARGQAEQASLGACERAQAIVSNPGAADAQSRLAEARAKQAEAEGAVARAGHALNGIRAAHATARSASAAVPPAPDFASQLAGLQARLDGFSATPATLRGKGNESVAALQAATAIDQSRQSAINELKQAVAPFQFTAGSSGIKELPGILDAAIDAYDARFKRSHASNAAAHAEKGCSATFEAAAAAIEAKLAAAKAKLKAAETEIQGIGAPPAASDHAAEIEAIFDTARTAGDAIASTATQAVTCVAAADSQVRNQASADAAALESKKKECAAALGRATAVWSPAQKQATCVCDAGYSFTSDRSKCVSESEFATLANGECARRVKGGISINRNAKAQTYDCGCRSGSVLNSGGSACVDVAGFNAQAAQQCNAQLPGSVATSTDPRTGNFQCGCPGDLIQSRRLNRCITLAEALQVAAAACAEQGQGRTVNASTFNPQTGTFQCQCSAGLTYSAAHNACLDPSQVAAINNAACEQRIPNSYAQYNTSTGGLDCYCRQGFANVSGRCVNEQAFRQQAVNECRTNYPNSILTGFDVNTGRYTCGCSFGYSWNGAGCSPIDFTPLITGGSKPAPKKNCHRNPHTGQLHCT